MQWKRRLAIGVLSLGILVGCATTGEQMATKEKSLYDRLGGKPAITAVVDDFTARVAADRRINRFFANTDVPAFKAKLVDQICEASGGPCKYTGKDMKTAHAGMGITDADFNALVEGPRGYPGQVQGAREREGRTSWRFGTDAQRHRDEIAVGSIAVNVRTAALYRCGLSSRL